MYGETFEHLLAFILWIPQNLSKTFFLTNGLSNCQKRPTLVGRFVFQNFVVREPAGPGAVLFEMQRQLTLLFLACLTVVGLMAFKTYKGAIFGGENIHYHAMTASQDFYSLSATTLEGEPFAFSELRGKRVLIVNTASRCGYTPQYRQLQSLHEQFGHGDFVVLGFPCNQFGRQEPGSAEQIGDFCVNNYGVGFQMMEKVKVKGDDQHPVYTWLCNADQNGAGDHKVAWNFHKFLVDEEGRIKASLKSGVDPLGSEISAFAAGK